MTDMQKPTIEERTLFALEKISRSISSLGSTFEQLYQNWKFPVGTMAEEMKPQLKEQREEQRVEKQLDLLRKQNTILIWTALVSIIAVVITVLVK